MIIQKDFESVTYTINDNHKGKDKRLNVKDQKLLYDKEQHRTER